MLGHRARLPLLACLVLSPGTAAPAAAPGKVARLDRWGDGLPPGALTRLGTVRLRGVGSVSALAFSPDGKMLVSAGGYPPPGHRVRNITRRGRGTISAWDPATGKELRCFMGHTEIARTVAISRDGKKLASAGDDGTVRLWETATGRPLSRVFAGDGTGSYAAFTPDCERVALCSLGEKVVSLRDVRTGKEVGRFAAPGSKMIIGMAFSPDGKLLAAGDYGNHQAVVWDARTGRLLHRLGGHNGGVWPVLFSPDGKLLLSSSQDDREMRFWDPRAGNLVRRFRFPAGCNAVGGALSANGGLLALSSAKGTLLLDTTTGKRVRLFEDPAASQFLALSPDGKTLAHSAAGAIRLTSLATGEDRVPLPGPIGPVEGVAFSPDGKRAATAGWSIQVWESATGRRIGPASRVGYSPCVAFSPDGKDLVFGGHDQSVRLVPSHLDKRTRRFSGDAGRVVFVTFLPGGQTVLSMGRQKYDPDRGGAAWQNELWVRLWDVRSGKQVGKVGKGEMDRVAVSADGKLLATGRHRVQVWDIAAGKQIRELRQNWPEVFSLGFSADGRLLAVTGYDAESDRWQVSLWEVASGQQVRRFRVEGGGAVVLTCSPDGNLLAAGGEDGIVRLWDVWSGEERHSFRGHRGPVRALHFSPDSRRLLSGSMDATALVWDVAGTLPPATPAASLRAAELDRLWADLAADAPRAFRSAARLVRSPAQAVALAGKHLEPVRVPDAKRVARLIRDLEDEDFAVRSRAIGRLVALGEPAEPALRKALAGAKDPDLRLRLNVVLRKLRPEELPPERLRAVRALGVLEQAGTPQARRLLKALAAGLPDALLTKQAAAALARLDRRRVAR